ncbi:MAG: carboxypeptidase-like regulatory domain-containing protein, partial [Chitinophagaceae bacterium]
MKNAANLKAGIIGILLPLLLFCTSESFSQNNEITVTGKVSSDSSVLEGATVQLKGTVSRAVQTKENGNYTLKVPANGTLIFSIVGYETQEVPINGQSTLNVIMKLTNSSMDDVVVTGFGGTQRKASMVSSITTINVAELKGPTGNLTNTLAGRIPGVVSFQRSGEPG